MKNLTTRDLTALGLLIALNVVFKQFLSVQLTESLRFSSYFIVIAITAAIYGPVTAGIAAVIADLLGAMLFPSPYGVFYGFTFSAFVEGIIYGLYLYNRKKSVANISLAVVTFTVVVSYFLNSLWVTMMNAEPSFILFISTVQLKLVKSLFIVPIQIIVLTLIFKYFEGSFSNVIAGLNNKKK